MPKILDVVVAVVGDIIIITSIMLYCIVDYDRVPVQVPESIAYELEAQVQIDSSGGDCVIGKKDCPFAGISSTDQSVVGWVDNATGSFGSGFSGQSRLALGCRSHVVALSAGRDRRLSDGSSGLPSDCTYHSND